MGFTNFPQLLAYVIMISASSGLSWSVSNNTNGLFISKLDEYLSKAPKWSEELEQLRNIILDCGLTEELKWSVPVYTFQKRNIVGINGLKEYCALAFFKGDVLRDANGILIKPGKNTKAGRWVKFTNVREIVQMKTILKAYIHEAIEMESRV